MRFPDLEGEDLNGRPLRFPLAFAETTVAIMAFGLEQRDAVESWVPFLDAEVVRRPQTRARLFAVVPNGMKLMRGALVQAFKRGATRPEQREATVLAFADVGALSAALDIAARDTIHLFVVAPGGEVREHLTGRYSEDAAQAVRNALA